MGVKKESRGSFLFNSVTIILNLTVIGKYYEYAGTGRNLC